MDAISAIIKLAMLRNFQTILRHHHVLTACLEGDVA